MGIHFGSFLVVAVVLIVVPGPDTALVAKNAAMHGRATALGSVVGVCLGLCLWTLAAALGIAAVVRSSAVAFTVLKTIGAVYLVALGLAALRAARRAPPHAHDPPPGPRRGLLHGVRQGIASNIANPKIAVTFTSLLPQFLDSDRAVVLPSLLLGGTFAAITFAWLWGFALAATRVGSALRRPRVQAWTERVTGTVLIGLGVRLATERR